MVRRLKRCVRSVENAASGASERLEMHVVPVFNLVLSDRAAVQKPVSLCVVFLYYASLRTRTPRPHSLPRWPPNVLCVRITLCQGTCVLRWRKEMMMMVIHNVMSPAL